jgi:hypothetical protein
MIPLAKARLQLCSPCGDTHLLMASKSCSANTEHLANGDTHVATKGDLHVVNAERIFR